MFRLGTRVRPVTQVERSERLVAAPFYRFVGNTITTQPASINDTSIFLDDLTGIQNGSHLIITDGVTNAFHICDVIGDVYTGNEVPIDTPLGYDLGAGAFVTIGDHDLTVPAGTLANPVTYQIRVEPPLQSEVAYDVYRIMMQAITTGVGDLSQFGDGAALTNGLVLRKKLENGTYEVFGNAKTNGELKQMMFDFDLLSASNPQQGANGFAGRFTNHKLGSVLKLGRGEDLEILVQDDLTSRVVSFGILSQGSISNIIT